MNKVKYGNLTHMDHKLMNQEFNQTVVNTVTNQGAKIGVVWLSIGVTSWAEAASFLAFVLSALALIEYVWKKILRPCFAKRGWVKPAKHRVKLVAVEEQEDE